MEVESLIVLLMVGMFKLEIYTLWKLGKRLDGLERANITLKKTIMVLHKEEFREIRDSLHRIKVNMTDKEEPSVGLSWIDEEASKIAADIWFSEGRSK